MDKQYKYSYEYHSDDYLFSLSKPLTVNQLLQRLAIGAINTSTTINFYIIEFRSAMWTAFSMLTINIKRLLKVARLPAGDCEVA